MTPRQEQLLDFIEAEQLAGRSPSVEEMQRHLDVASRSNVARLLDALEEGGFIKRRRQRARSVVSTRLDLRATAERIVAHVDRWSHSGDGLVMVPREEVEALRAALPAQSQTAKAA